MIPTSIRLPAEVIKALQDRAKVEGRSLNNLIGRILADHVKQSKGKK